MDSVNIASDAGTGFSHYSTSASIIVINKTRLFDGIGSLKVGNLFFRNRTKICLYCLYNLAINPFVFNETGIVPFLTLICLCKYFDKHAFCQPLFSLHRIDLKLMTL